MASSRPKGQVVPHMLKVILLGDGGVGKSSLMNVFVNNKFDTQLYHTIGVEFLIKDVTVDRQKFTLQIWDTAGQERFRSLRTPFYRGADCCLLTFSIADRKSFQSIALWQKEFLFYANVPDADAERFPFVVLGNKVDVDARQVGRQEAQEWCDANGLPYYETSAKNAVNVDVAFEAVVRHLMELDVTADVARRTKVDTVTLSKGEAGDHPVCC